MANDSQQKKLLSIGTDRLLFEEGSAVRKRYVDTYSKQWAEIHIIVATDKSFQETAIAPNVWVYPTRSVSKALYPLDAIKLGRFIISRRGITHITCQDPFLTAMAGVTLKKQFKLPLELQVHTDIGSPNYAKSFSNKVRKALAMSYLSKADSIRVVSNRIKSYLTDIVGIADNKIFVRPIVVNVEAIKNAPITIDLHKKYPQFDKIVLVASRLEKEKNVGLAIQAWKEVVKEMPKAGLIIVGAGSQLNALKAVAPNNSSVVFESWADQATLASYYKSADLFLNTSMFEGYGMTLVEAHAAGCPIVSMDVGVAREMGATIVDWSPESISRGITGVLRV